METQFHGIVAASYLGASLLMLVKDDQTTNEVHTKILLSASLQADDLCTYQINVITVFTVNLEHSL
jgi:hypothetical protein